MIRVRNHALRSSSLCEWMQSIAGSRAVMRVLTAMRSSRLQAS